jgi:hypothetical protein
MPTKLEGRDLTMIMRPSKKAQSAAAKTDD